jgi:hypothetical protein
MRALTVSFLQFSINKNNSCWIFEAATMGVGPLKSDASLGCRTWAGALDVAGRRTDQSINPPCANWFPNPPCAIVSSGFQPAGKTWRSSRQPTTADRIWIVLSGLWVAGETWRCSRQPPTESRWLPPPAATVSASWVRQNSASSIVLGSYAAGSLNLAEVATAGAAVNSRFKHVDRRNFSSFIIRYIF